MYLVRAGSVRALAGAVLALALSGPCWAVSLYSENFEVDPTANWTVNNGPSDEAHNFFFDYSSVGIPSAPNSGGTTHGMKLQANLVNGIFSGMSVSPTGQSFTGDYTVTFDWWANSNGPFPGGGSGSTNLSTFGIGTVGNTAQWPGGTTDSVWFAATGDGGSSADYRAYSTAAPTSYSDGDSVYAAPSRNASDPYYAGFGSVGAPAAQILLFPQQTGVIQAGAAGMAWHQVVIAKSGNTASWSVDGLPIATIDLNTVTLSGTNIFFGHSDINATSSTDFNDSDLLFTLVDNIEVTSNTNGVVPEPLTAATAVMGLVAVGSAVLRRRKQEVRN